MPVLLLQGHLRNEHGGIGDGCEHGAENQLQGQRDLQRTPLNPQRRLKGRQQYGQQQQVLQQARIPCGKQHDIGHMRHAHAHAVGIQDVRQGYVHPEQAGDT